MFRKTSRFNDEKYIDFHSLNADVSQGYFPNLLADILKSFTVIAADVIEHVQNPVKFVESLVNVVNKRKIRKIIVPSWNRINEFLPPSNQHYIGEWTIQELAAYLISGGAAVKEFILTNTRKGMVRLGK